MSSANIKCPHCGGEYQGTDQPGIFECPGCGDELNQLGSTAELLRSEGYEEIAEAFDRTAEVAETDA